jgi:hypothetical protein
MDTLRELEPVDYEWEDEPRCTRCGTTHYLVCDTETKAIYCAPCVRVLHEKQPRPLKPVEGVEDLDFYL